MYISAGCRSYSLLSGLLVLVLSWFPLKSTATCTSCVWKHGFRDAVHTSSLALVAWVLSQRRVTSRAGWPTKCALVAPVANSCRGRPGPLSSRLGRHYLDRNSGLVSQGCDRNVSLTDICDDQEGEAAGTKGVEGRRSHGCRGGDARAADTRGLTESHPLSRPRPRPGKGFPPKEASRRRRGDGPVVALPVINQRTRC